LFSLFFAANTRRESLPAQLGKQEELRVQLFATVGRSMLTVFRCFVDGCSAQDGTPLAVHMYNTYGWWTAVIYGMSMLFVTFGLFNLIMAVFVENTMEVAKYDEARRQRLKKKQSIEAAQSMQRLVEKIYQVARVVHNNSGTTLITQEAFNKVVSDSEVENLLERMDISLPDNRELFDVFDADGDGALDLDELVSGIVKLRGCSNKTHLVATTLAVRATQQTVKWLEMAVSKHIRITMDLMRKVDTLEQTWASRWD